MHIPDGYLSPSTCAVLYGASAPFWYTSLRRMKQLASTRTIPLVSVLAAFSFVIMMFNLPLPGGTTGHAIGIGISAILLGPWGAVAAISIALTIQALLFGDGGLTALGANCFNMGVSGSLVAYCVYRLAAGKSPLRSGRRVLAAGLAGYLAINAAALLAAIEFGVQPLWFHTAAGVPLYCPYPLHIAIPAMMIGHLTLAGLAELTISAGVVRYLQSSDTSLLRLTAPGVPLPEGVELLTLGSVAVPRRYWVALAVLLLLSPLGILAAGSAWGEWSPQEVASALPAGQAPQGMASLATLWDAPLARYSPKFAGNVFVAYLMSALFGMGVVVLCVVALNWLFSRMPKRRTAQRGFVERTVERLARAVERSITAEKVAQGQGLLQGMDARVKLGTVALLLIAAASVHHLIALLCLLLLAITLAILSGIPAPVLATRAWLPAFLFSGLLAVPALFLTPGPEALRVIDVSVTWTGLSAATVLLARVLTATTLSLLLVFTTEWNRILRALRFFRIPVAAVVLLGMTYRYLFVLLRTAQEMFEARRARLVGAMEESERQRLASASVGILLEKTVQLSQEIHLAMQARGFRGEVYFMDDRPLAAQGWSQLGLFAAVSAAAIFWGR